MSDRTCFKANDIRGEIGGNIDEMDCVSLAFDEWRFNLRSSNTEPLGRLNIKGKGKADTFSAYVSAISDLLSEMPAQDGR